MFRLVSFAVAIIASSNAVQLNSMGKPPKDDESTYSTGLIAPSYSTGLLGAAQTEATGQDWGNRFSD